MLTVAIFLGGVALIFPIFFKCADILSQLNARYVAAMACGNLLAETEAALQDTGTPGSRPSEGRVSAGTRELTYSEVTTPVLLFFRTKLLGQKSVYKCEITLEDFDGRSHSFSRSAYVSQ
jgi:hypothetical protein